MHGNTKLKSQPTLSSCHYIACGPSKCLPHPRSPTHHLSPAHSTLVITFLSPTLCHTHTHTHTHTHPHHFTQLSVLILSCCLHILVRTHPCHLAQPPSVFHLQQPSTTQFHSLTASLFPASTYTLLIFIVILCNRSGYINY